MNNVPSPNIETPYRERALIGQFLDALRGLPDIFVNPPRWEHLDPAPHSRFDAEVDLIVAGKEVTLLIEAKKTAYPRDVHQFLSQLRFLSRHDFLSSNSPKQISFLVAEAISPGAKELLRSERVGYYESSGSLFLPARGAYLYIEKPPTKIAAKSIKSLFSGRRAQVLQALLLHPREWFGGNQLAEKAMVSPATVSDVLSELERLDWVSSRGQGPSKERLLKEPAALLNTWVDQLPTLHAPRLRRFYAPSLKKDHLLQPLNHAFSNHKVDYAISYEVAAQCYAPYLSEVSQVRCRLIPGPAAEAALSDLGARVVTEGMNLAVIEVKFLGEMLFREYLHGAWFANPIQVYLDLFRSEGRAREMADHLRKAKISFQ